jgi:hypothetical protein
MPWIRDPAQQRSFSGKRPSEWVQVPDDDVPYLVETYNVEVRQDDGEATAPALKPVEEPAVEPAVIERPYHKGSGWWVWRGGTYRRSQLPPEAEELIGG